MNAIKGSFNVGGEWQENFKSKNEFEWIINHLTCVNHITSIIYKNKIVFEETVDDCGNYEIFYDLDNMPEYISDFVCNNYLE